jgi:predicted Zn-dependent peptidase
MNATRVFWLLSILLFPSLGARALPQNPSFLHVATPKMPLMSASLFFPFGCATESKEFAGAAHLLKQWAPLGTQKYSKTEIAQKKAQLGAQFEFEISTQFSTLTVEAPQNDFLEAWNLALEIFRKPKLSDTDLETIRVGVINSKANRLSDWVTAGVQLGKAVAYAGTAQACSEYGTEHALKTLTSIQLKRFHQDTFFKGPSAILLSDNISGQLEKSIRASLVGWTAPYEPRKTQPFLRNGKNMIIVERPESTQSYLFFVKPGPIPGTKDHALVSLATQILGSNGGNSSILFDELRAKQGLTYHASISTSRRPHLDTIFGITFGSNENIEALASGFLKHWSNFAQKTDFLLDDLKEASLAEAANRNRKTGETIAQLLATAAQTYSVTMDVKPIWATTPVSIAEFNAAKSKWLQANDFTLLAFGDSTKIREPLTKALGKVMDLKILPENSDWDMISNAVAKSETGNKQ